MNNTIQTEAMAGDNTAVVEVSTPGFVGGDLKGSGWAKKHPKDKPSKEVGYNLAMARALRDLADKFETQADVVMKQNELPDNWTGVLAKRLTNPPFTYNTITPFTYGV